MASDGLVMTREDQAAWQRPHQAVACFLIGADGRIRWARIDPWTVPNDGDGALTNERDRHRVGVHAVAGDAARQRGITQRGITQLTTWR